MNKRGQFFLMAAFIIVGMLISAKVVYNIANSPEESTQIIDLSKEINFESVKVIDNRVFTEKKDTLNANIESLSDTYASLYPRSELVFILGNSSEYTVYSYLIDSQGFVSAGESGSKIINRKKDAKTFVTTGDKINFVLDEKTSRNFEVKKGQNFYIIVKNEKNGEEIVASN